MYGQSQFRGGSVYASTARFDTARALSEDEMHRKAPSIFATAPHASRSDRFRAIATIEILRGLMKEGFMPVGVKQSNSRDVSRRDFTKHMIRLRRLDDSTKSLKVGDSVFEILLKNGNDGSSVYDLLGGIFKIRCMNSLVSQTGTVDSVKVRHTGDDIQHRVIDGTYRVLNEAEKVLAAPQDWSQILLSPPEKMILAEEAHKLRFADAEGEVKTPIKPAQLLTPRRPEDNRDDLWQTFNNVQEHCIVGGDSAMGRDVNGRRRRMTSRHVNGIDADVKLNQALWALTAKMAELKRAA